MLNNFSANTSVTIQAQQNCATYLASNCIAQRSSIVTHFSMQSRTYKSAFKKHVQAHIKFKRQMSKPVADDILFDFDES